MAATARLIEMLKLKWVTTGNMFAHKFLSYCIIAIFKNNELTKIDKIQCKPKGKHQHL